MHWLLVNFFIFLPQDAIAHDTSMQILELLGVIHTSKANQRLSECGGPLQDDHISPLERDHTDSPDGNHTGPSKGDHTGPKEGDHTGPKQSHNTSLTEGVHAEDDHASLQEDNPYQIDRGCSY